ncbi:hypothetical protein [Beijerinckia indica]|uniref:Uncharacterized protein n=1 Tax=Beijerinckia indica subsp. indica (strain ATCC 9039 / DSM 1715 / NCIMB 8712) TaxID=395963 RepID=B2ICF7_BEII9|nr:hypothetical protein [Beijerinckia indica]ACB93846.1 hypothetical protein Bind_0190 [Beijerinckia indica subsp. indica ATCC 9039]
MTKTLKTIALSAALVLTLSEAVLAAQPVSNGSQNQAPYNYNNRYGTFGDQTNR